MKISPLPATGMTVGAVAMDSGVPTQTMAQKIRSLKMSTNATPGRVVEPPPEPLAASAIAPEGAELPISDASVDPATAAPEVIQPLSPQLAALARERRSLQVKEREIAAREKALSDRLTSQGEHITKEQLAADPFGTMLKHGLTWEQLTDAMVAHQRGHNPDVLALQQKVSALEEGFDKKLTERDALQKQQALAEMKREADGLVTQGDDFELVRETKSVPEAMRLIENVYDKTGEVLAVPEALRLVEAELVKDAMRLANLKKVQNQIAPAPVAPQAPHQPQRQVRTLTNRDTATTAPIDRKARALAAWNGTLKK